ncbi:Aste57867_22401 [Aphanomyces stellatus]|uniref:Aste57867_22401 protein n=1 Tax=Aphanomyces stellatus TaxID=120398 RepID=A0A485LLH9_9STRA|nr:hypothetical protein As57867_022331 [Aphanomyces stellatus]VFT99064.1 Aste57867_22401 [Aphanomyces stellatus]
MCADTLRTAAGLFYVVATVACSCLYLHLLASYVANDFWWSRFNTTAGQTFLADLYNTKLALGLCGNLDLLANTSVLPKTYGVHSTYSMRQAVARKTLLANPTLDVAIAALRQNYLFVNIVTLYPAVRAPTLLPQRDAVWNAAVHLESLLRCTRHVDLISSTYFNAINSTIFAAVATTPTGRSWVNGLLYTRPWLPLDDEVAAWTSHGLVLWQHQLQNRFIEGLQESIAVVNALGMVNTITIGSIPATARSLGAWSTQYTSYGLNNDLSTCVSANATMVRSWHVSVPPALLQFVRVFQGEIWTRAQSNLSSLSSILLDAPFIQPSFDYYDNCSLQIPHMINLTPMSVLLAMIDTNMAAMTIPSACGPCQTMAQACIAYLTVVFNVYHTLVLSTTTTQGLGQASTQLLKLHLTYMQLATRNGTNVVLTQPVVVNPPTFAWSLIGWITLYDWVDGLRGVYSFTGDCGSVAIMSQSSGYLELGSVPLELPQAACKYVCLKLETAHGMTGFVPSPPPLWQTLVVAGEACWVTYALNDGFHPLTQQSMRLYAPLSAIATLVYLTLHTSTDAYAVDATMGCNCTILSFKRGVVSLSGSVRIGCHARVLHFRMVAGGSVVASYVAVRCLGYCMAVVRGPTSVRDKDEHMLIPASADAFFTPGHRQFDSMTCDMAGIMTFPSRIFNVTLWSVFDVADFALGNHSFHRQVHPNTDAPCAVAASKTRLAIRKKGVGGSSTWLRPPPPAFSSSFLDNDFLWVTFHASSSTQVYLSTWFNDHFQLAMASWRHRNTTDIAMSPLYATWIQDEVHTVATVIASLRTTHGCVLPWIATAYCYVDLDRRWELANSASAMQHDRGAQWRGVFGSHLTQCRVAQVAPCCGTALIIGIFAYVDTSKARRGSSEAAHWPEHGIVEFVTQWQNYKLLGVVETFTIASALGWSHPMTLKRSSSATQLSSRTSFKLYWMLANDLGAIDANATSMQSASLVRGSPTFAFQNASLEMVLQATEDSVATPWNQTLILGEFRVCMIQLVSRNRRSIWVGRPQARHVAPLAPTLVSKGDAGHHARPAFRQGDPNCLCQDSLPTCTTTDSMGPCPILAWEPPCQSYIGSFSEPLVFFSHLGPCRNFLSEVFSVSTLLVLKAIVAAGLLFGPTPPLWLCDSYDSVETQRMFELHIPFLETYMAHDDAYQQLQARATSVKTDIRDTLQLALPCPVNTFDPMEPDMEFCAWLYLFDWIEGKREVVRFQGDVGTITTISTEEPASQSLSMR